MSDLQPEVLALGAAVQAFASAISDDNVLVTQALVIYECASFADDGESQRSISYACPTDNFALSGALGLLEAGRFYIRRDVLADDDPDE